MDDGARKQRLLIHGPRMAAFEAMDRPACARHEVLIAAEKTAISPGTELRVYRATPVDEAGKFLHETVPFALPAENGYSMVGVVAEVGTDVCHVQPGQRVFAPAPHKAWAALPENLVTPLADSLPSDQAVFLNILEVGHLGLRRASPLPGETVAVVGLGVIGLSALALASQFGLRTIAVDFSEPRRQIATALGAHLTLSPSDENFLERVHAFCGRPGVDIAIEAAGNWSAVRTAMELAAPSARVVVVSRLTQLPNFNPLGHPFLGKKLTLLTSYGYPPDGQRWDRRSSQSLTLELLAQGKLSIAPMITHRRSWRELPDVYRRLDAGSPDWVGVVLDWTN